MEAGAASNVVRMRQLSLDAGGATVDSSRIDGVTWAAGTKDLEGEFKKGSDVRMTVIMRTVGIHPVDKYDGHGNIAETIRGHDFRIDTVESIEVVNPRAYKTAAEAAAEEDAAGDGDEGAVGGGEPAADASTEGDAPADQPPAEPEDDPFDAS